MLYIKYSNLNKVSQMCFWYSCYYICIYRWSFGILLWEIFTLGGSPYPGLPTEDLLKFLEGGKRMECPDRCPKDVYKIMYNCWVRNPDDRPLFAQLVEQLNDIMKHNALEVVSEV